MPFKKGQSGNPGGRPRENYEVRNLARSHTEEAIERLAFWMRSDNAKASPAACNALLNRAWGTPVQMTELTGRDGGPLEWKQVTDLELGRMIAFALESAGRELDETVH